MGVDRGTNIVYNKDIKHLTPQTMRIWHEQLIPKLCQKHLCGMWREALGAYKIISDNRTDLAYFKHPATQEFVNAPIALWHILSFVKLEMESRGYHPKDLPPKPIKMTSDRKPWQTLAEQTEHLKLKNCKCEI